MVVQELVARDMCVALLPRLSLTAYRHPGIAVLDVDERYGRHLLLVTSNDEARPEVLDVARRLRKTTMGSPRRAPRPTPIMQVSSVAG